MRDNYSIRPFGECCRELLTVMVNGVEVAGIVVRCSEHLEIFQVLPVSGFRELCTPFSFRDDQDNVSSDYEGEFGVEVAIQTLHRLHELSSYVCKNRVLCETAVNEIKDELRRLVSDSVSQDTIHQYRHIKRRLLEKLPEINDDLHVILKNHFCLWELGEWSQQKFRPLESIPNKEIVHEESMDLFSLERLIHA